MLAAAIDRPTAVEELPSESRSYRDEGCAGGQERRRGMGREGEGRGVTGFNSIPSSIIQSVVDAFLS